VKVELVDTAGIEQGEGAIAARAQELRSSQAERADLVLECVSADTIESSQVSKDRPHLRIWTKCDLAPPRDEHLLSTSAECALGLDELRSAIGSRLRAQVEESSAVVDTGARCRESLERAGQALRTAAETLILSGGDELVAIDLRQAVDELGKVVGAVVTDDILDRIFRRFCIGK
jgi:tRNA modification GTPase